MQPLSSPWVAQATGSWATLPRFLTLLMAGAERRKLCMVCTPLSSTECRSFINSFDHKTLCCCSSASILLRWWEEWSLRLPAPCNLLSTASLPKEGFAVTWDIVGFSITKRSFCFLEHTQFTSVWNSHPPLPLHLQPLDSQNSAVPLVKGDKDTLGKFP